jgi:hypothetical protein
MINRNQNWEDEDAAAAADELIYTQTYNWPNS